MNFQENLFSSSSWSLMQLTQPKNVVKITHVFCSVDYHGGHDISFVTGGYYHGGSLVVVMTLALLLVVLPGREPGKTCGELCMAKVVMSTMEV